MTGVLRLEDQAATLAVLVPAHTTTARVRQFAAHMDKHAGQAQHMHEMLGQWGCSAPPLCSPGAVALTGTGPGTMGHGWWDEMGRMHGDDFNEHFADAMIASRTAEIALRRTELTDGASSQARGQAPSMLTERQAELTQLRGWQHRWQHDNESMHGYPRMGRNKRGAEGGNDGGW